MGFRVTTQRSSLLLRDSVYLKWTREGKRLRSVNRWYGCLLFHALSIDENNPVLHRLVELQQDIVREDPRGLGLITLWFPDPQKHALFLGHLKAMRRLIAVPVFNYHLLNVAMGIHLRDELPSVPRSLLLEWHKP